MLQNMYKKAAGLWVELRVELLSAIEYYAEDKVNSAQIWRLYWASHQVIAQKSYCYYSLTFSTQIIWDHWIREKILI
jgi:hypothetical protein